MSWKPANSLSITSRLLLIFTCSLVLILLIITGLIYPPLKELLYQSNLSHQHYCYLLTQICIKKFFIGLWLSVGIIIIASYLVVKKSLKPIERFTKELESISASSLDKRLPAQGQPKELQDLAATCNEMLLRVENAFKQIRQFSASMAHELKNPIHYLQTATEITLAKSQTVEAYEEVLQTHLEEYRGLTTLIDNLLFLTRYEHRQIQLNTQPVSAQQLINSIIDYYELMAQENEIDIHIQGDAQIEVDENLFKRVISNLIDNSLAYTQKGGNILIQIEQNAGEAVVIRVNDNGKGIAKEHLPCLSQGFYRVDNRLNQDNAGLGLGLMIAKVIMELHQGQLKIESQLGIGTCVILTL